MNALIYHAKGGLANRLRALVGYRTLARLRGVPFLIYWELNGACGEEFHALFEPAGFEDLEFISAEQMKRVATAGGEVLSAGIWFADIWRRHAQGEIDQSAFYRDSAAALRMLRPVEAIQGRIERFAEERSLGQCTGVHIRMTDNLQAYDWWARNEPDFDPGHVSQLEGFERVIGERQAAGERVFLCTDNADLGRRLSVEHSNVFTYEKVYNKRGLESYLRRRSGSRSLAERVAERVRGLAGGKRERSWRTTPIADAVVDLFLLARCRSVIGTYYSSFAPVAAMIGSHPMGVICGVQCVEHPAVREMQAVLSRQDEAGSLLAGGAHAT